jgi:hypothetical protein
MGEQAGEDVIDDVDREHDAADAKGVHRRVLRLRPHRRGRVELVELDPAMAVRGPHRHDLGSNALERDEAVH